MLKYLILSLIILLSSCDDGTHEKQDLAVTRLAYIFSFPAPSTLQLPSGTFTFNQKDCHYLPQYYVYPFTIKITTSDGNIFSKNVTIDDVEKEYNISNSLSILFHFSYNNPYNNRNFEVFTLLSTNKTVTLSIEINSTVTGSVIVPMQKYDLYHYNNIK